MVKIIIMNTKKDSNDNIMIMRITTTVNNKGNGKCYH